MRALTVCQPYASLIVGGSKRVENRRWPTRYRGPLLIHAGKSTAWLDRWAAGVPADIPLPDPLPMGAIVGQVEVVTCLSIEEVVGSRRGHLAWLDRHPHAEGPWCWILQRPEQYAVPIPYRGSQGIFDVGMHALAGSVLTPGCTPGVCRVCNCTDRFGCDVGCHWVEPDLCSVCAPMWPQKGKS
jgi:hypothetical protein